MSAGHCRGCRTAFAGETPTPDHCGECPPWRCDGCGQMNSMADPCASIVSRVSEPATAHDTEAAANRAADGVKGAVVWWCCDIEEEIA